MSRPLPSVRVIVPTYNSKDIVGRAIRSVLAQDFDGRLEIIVVDDGSCDGTADFVKQKFPQVKVIQRSTPSGGPGLPRNIGARDAKTEFLAFLDADDEWYPEKLQKQINVFQRMPGVALVTCFPEFVKDGVSVAGRQPQGGVVQATLRDWLWRNPTCWDGVYPSGWVIRRSVFETVGPFVDGRSQDLEYLFRLTASGYTVAVIREPLYKYQLSSQSITGNSSRKCEGVSAVMEYVRQLHPTRGAPWAQGLLSEKEYYAAFAHLVLRFLPVLAAYEGWSLAKALCGEAMQEKTPWRLRARLAVAQAAVKVIEKVARTAAGRAFLGAVLRLWHRWR